MPVRTVVRIATACVASALLCSAVPSTAGAVVTIHLLTGEEGTPCAQDPNVKFTSPSVLTPQPAIVGTGAPADPCHVEDFLNLPGKTRAITTTNSSDDRATFTITFELPNLYGNPRLDLTMWVDNGAFVLLNGHSLVGPCPNPQFPISATNPTWFVAGTNTLTIHVFNGPDCFTSGPRSGPGDAMNLQFQGTVTYDPPPAGGGLNLGWDDCGGQPASLNRTFACDTNVGTHVLIGSFMASSNMVAVTGMAAVLDLQGPVFNQYPAWWNIRVGGCRTTSSLISNFNFTAGPFTCNDYWQGGAVGGHAMDAPVGNRARFKATCALPSGDSRIGPILQGTEVYAFRFTINNARTVGLGACAGCQTGMCIVFNSMIVTQTPGNPAGNKYISSPANRSNVTWQGGLSSDCYGATPARNVTWGSIKSRYR